MRSRRAPTNGVVSTLAGATKRAAGHQQDVSDLREIHENNISWSDSKKWPPLLHHCAVISNEYLLTCPLYTCPCVPRCL